VTSLACRQAQRSGVSAEEGALDDYPILVQRRLQPVKVGLLRRRRRAMEELPEVLPNTRLVFEVGGDYRCPEDGRLKLTSHEVVDATAVFLVSLRQKDMVVAREVPRRSGPPGRLVIRATFGCVVVDPEELLRTRATDVDALLRMHLTEAMPVLDDDTDPADSHTIVALLYSYTRIEGVDIAGMEVKIDRYVAEFKAANGVLTA
jgi:hypothetical protein